MRLHKMVDFTFKEMTKNKKHLKYHNKNHIIDCLLLANQIFNENKKDFQDYDFITIDLSQSKYKKVRDLIGEINLPLSAFISILFHDIVYNIKSKTNEKESAVFMYCYVCENHQPIMFDYEKEINLAYDIIEATKYHKTDTNHDCHKNLFSTIFDIDMSYFLKDKKEYIKTVKNIMDEYLSTYTTEQYIKGRIEFLNKILYNKIYNSIYFQDFNEKAKQNIQEEIKFLNNIDIKE